MIPTMVIVQHQQVSDKGRQALEFALDKFARRHFGSSASIDWIVVPKGSGFTAADPSTSLIVSMQSNRALSSHERQPMLRELSDLGIRLADRTPCELVVAIRDPMTGGDH